MSSGTDGPRTAKCQEDGQAALSFNSGPPGVLDLITSQEEEWRLHSVKTALKGPEMPFEVPGV
jgi:hypothetical protein